VVHQPEHTEMEQDPVVEQELVPVAELVQEVEQDLVAQVTEAEQEPVLAAAVQVQVVEAELAADSKKQQVLATAD
jgi:hypothetical protein